MRTQKFGPSFFVIALWLMAVMMPSLVFAGGRTEHHQINSRIMADAGQDADRNISVYLPEGYDSANQAYSVLYLLHGAFRLGGNPKVFFGEPYHQVGGRNINVNIDSMVDGPIENGKMHPLIIVMPNVAMKGPGYMPWDKHIAQVELIVDYLAKEVVPFIDTQYRTVSNRQGRAIAGHSNGGGAAATAAFLYPELFSLVGLYASDILPADYNMPLLEMHNQSLYPLEFWVYAGKRDGAYLGGLQATQILKEMGMPAVFIEDNGDHFAIAPRLEESIVFFSENLSSPVTSVEPHSKLTTTWGEMKRSR